MMKPSTSGNAANNDLVAELKSLKVDQLKQELRKRQLKTTGLKEDLVLRLLPCKVLERQLQDDNEDNETRHHDDAKNKNNKNIAVSERSQASTSKIRRNLTLNLMFEEGEESLETSSGDDKVSKEGSQECSQYNNITRSKNDTRYTKNIGQYGAIMEEGKSKMEQSREKTTIGGETSSRRNNDETKTKNFCFLCGSRNHLSITCPTKDRGIKCFECNQYGHIAKLCRETKYAKPHVRGLSGKYPTLRSNHVPRYIVKNEYSSFRGDRYKCHCQAAQSFKSCNCHNCYNCHN